MWQAVAKVSEVGEGKSLQLQMGQQQIALFKSGGQFYAIDGFCPHRGGPLGQGYLDGNVVTCPWHAWTFEVKTGECQNVQGTKQKTFPVKVGGEHVLVDV